MGEHQRSLAFPEVSKDLLAIGLPLAHKVQQIVLDLKCRAQKMTEPIEASRVNLPLRRDQGSNTTGVNAGVPACLLQGHAQIVVAIQVAAIVANPAQLDSLPFNRLNE